MFLFLLEPVGILVDVSITCKRDCFITDTRAQSVKAVRSGNKEIKSQILISSLERKKKPICKCFLVNTRGCVQLFFEVSVKTKVSNVWLH